MKMVGNWLTSVGLLVGQALLAFAIARVLNPNAMLVGPFLLISPFLALLVASLLFFSRSDASDLDEDEGEISARLDQLCHRLKKIPSIRLEKENGDREVIQRARAYLIVNVLRWNELSSGEKDFMLARRVAELEAEQAKAKGRYLWTAAVLLAGVAAALSLWSILFSHAMLAIYAVIAIRHEATSGTLAADRRAVEMTCDKGSAIRVVRAEHAKSPSPFVTLEERIAAIESVGLKP